MLLCVINALEKLKVTILDIPEVFLQVDMHELVHIKVEGVLVELLVKIDPNQCTKYAVEEREKTVIYTVPVHPLYGTLRYSLLFWRNLPNVLVENGY